MPTNRSRRVFSQITEITDIVSQAPAHQSSALKPISKPGRRKSQHKRDNPIHDLLH
ncbi:MAG: hypothetical protein AAGL10_15655 [Pseudomonadota bacterium]